MTRNNEYDAIVIGAGAAGMMCAAVAGRRGRRVAIVEHYRKLGEKIRISGGGRCNFTNLHCRPENYLSRNPSFCRSALARYGPREFIALVERHGIRYHEKTLGQLFCDESSLQIVAMLKAECDLGRVHWHMPCAVASVERSPAGFTVRTSAGGLHAAALVIATGGLTVPKIGATAFGYRIAEQFGLRVVPPRAGLVPLTFDAEWLDRFGALAGISLPCEVRCGEGRFREQLLFTHRGLSGPAILQISSYWTRGEALAIDLLPERDVEAWFIAEQASRARLDNLLSGVWPRRFAQAWCALNDCERALNTISLKRLRELAGAIKRWQVVPTGTLGYNKAEVTLGGVDTRDLSSRTMAAVRAPGLYFVGEVVDVTGHLGGYNFQWAWASGHAAGTSL